MQRAIANVSRFRIRRNNPLTEADYQKAVETGGFTGTTIVGTGLAYPAAATEVNIRGLSPRVLNLRCSANGRLGPFAVTVLPLRSPAGPPLPLLPEPTLVAYAD
jgi:hypothetical protein